MMDAEEFGRRVLQRRKELKLSQEALAQRAHMSRNYVSLIERGEAANVSTAIVINLATALGITPAELWQVEEDADRLIPTGLRQLGLEAGLRYDVVDKLARLPRRGREPKTAAEWRRLYEAIRVYIDEDVPLMPTRGL